jgi:GNAT superfamily N-acetyltransferase
MAMVIGCNKATLTCYDRRRVGCPTLCGGGVSTPYGSKTVYSANVPAHLVKPKLRYMGVSNTRMQASPAPLSREEQQPPRDGLNVVGKPKVVSGLTTNAPPPPPISKSDAVFLEELGVEFVWGTSDLSVDELNDLFEKVGFPRRDPGRLATALVNTHRSIWVRAARKSRLAKQGQLLGFGRATSDGALSATIWDVAVAPAWQRGGLGRGLVERLTASLVDEGIPIVTLYAEPGVVGLYEKLGFVKDPLAVKGLAFQTKSERGQKLLASIQ